jgi:hypothetical protein
MGALTGGTDFAGELGAGFCGEVGAGVCVEAKSARSNALNRHEMPVKLDARMRRAPRKYSIKRRRGRAKRMGPPYSESKERGDEGAGGAEEKIS